jgi:molybdenum cofactor cytidylyltransferase
LKVSAVLLASGASRRLGRPKQLLEWRGSLLINKIIDSIQESMIDELVIVLGYKHDEISKILGKSHQILVNKTWELGKSESIKNSLHEIAPRSDAVVFFSIDQPFLSTELINQIVFKARSSEEDIIATRSGGISTIPMLFKKRVFNSFEILQGEEGGKKLLALPQYKSDYIDWDDERILIDLDTESSYQAALKADSD